MTLDGRSAMVTGAAGGIGRAVVLALLERGCRVAGVDNDPDGLAALEESASGYDTFMPIRADVGDEGGVDRAYVLSAERFGLVDLLHNNAGILDAVGPLQDVDSDVFDRVMRVNARSQFLFLRRFAANLVPTGRRGAVVNTASAAGLKGSPGLVAYSMSKQAVVGMTRSAAVEFGSAGIRVNAVCPGRVDTAMIRGMEHLGDQEAAVNARPIGRVAAPEEIAHLVVWLLSDEASFATGCIYPIDGGLTA